ncbi:helix-turn-helix transcriptional regulator [Deinococcus sp. NW-56]|uniref:helix-turn-helix domain-containing protein n=1 Tax=Deinococcus sp. NW-56 TaxID=2080419 RepID=UPI000CF51485|nr:helix-turn-helix transcriptional regulator [Deinococcus sp. NW-56]
MALIRLRLSTYLQEAGITPAALAAAVHPTLSRNTVYRLLRQEDTITRLDFPTLAALMTALRQLTGKPVDFADLLELDESV